MDLLRDGRPNRRASPWVRALGSISLLGSVTSGGCLNEPEPCLIDLNEGDLVVTELRGPQDEASSWGEWIELYNATDETIDLRGLRGTFERLKGTEIDNEAALTFLVRDSLEVAAGDYVVLGTLPLNATRLPAVDYSINSDFRTEPPIVDATGGVIIPPEEENTDPRALFSSARLRLYSCERVIESLSYTGLPGMGTLSFDGARTPDAEDNDDLCARWCTDDVSEPLVPDWNGATGIPGTPGLPNIPCDPDPQCES